MADKELRKTAEIQSRKDVSRTGKWAEKYAAKHRLVRVRDFPDAISPPRKVRIYVRGNRYHLLQWWDAIAKRTLSERVDGDLLDSLIRARQIDQRLDNYRSAGHRTRRVGHPELVEAYETDLHRRADAGEIDTRTVKRYSSALTNHYLAYAQRPDVERKFGQIANVNREFALGFATFLNGARVVPNGCLSGRSKPMRGQYYVLDLVRGMYEWASDPDRGALLGDGFRNPFLRQGCRRPDAAPDRFGEPDISIPMAVDFVMACDTYQLKLFSPLIFYGLRPSELCFLFEEHLDQAWMRVVCQPELDYFTKGRRDKYLPFVPCLREMFATAADIETSSLLFLRRRVVERREEPQLLALGRSDLIAEFQRHCATNRVHTAAERRRARDEIHHKAGGITYDHVVAEFAKLHRQLKWPNPATLKDFRHLSSTCFENSGIPQAYCRYLLGQSPGKATIVTYTHLNKAQQHYQRVLDNELKPIVEAVVKRSNDLAASKS